MLRTIATAFVLVLLTVSVASAHRVTIFAYTEGDVIVTESGFPGGGAAKDCPVEVYDASTGDKLLEGNSGEEGIFRFPISDTIRKAASGLNIVIVAGEGHKGEWFLEPEEYGAGAASEAAVSETAASATTSATTSEGGATAQNVSTGLSEARLEAIVERAVDKKLAPIKRKLLEDNGPSVSDVLGGIGYLIGLAGIAAWARSRKAQSGKGKGRS